MKEEIKYLDDGTIILVRSGREVCRLIPEDPPPEALKARRGPRPAYLEDSITDSVGVSTSFTTSVSHSRSYSESAQCVRRASLHYALHEFSRALETLGPLSIDDAAWLTKILARIIMGASA